MDCPWLQHLQKTGYVSNCALQSLNPGYATEFIQQTFIKNKATFPVPIPRRI